MSTAWDNARRHARALETALGTKLSTYSRLAADISRSAGGSREREDREELDEGEGGYKLVEEEIEELLGKLEQAIDDLMTLINSPSQPPSASMQHAAQRHRDNLDDYRRDFLRTRNNVEAAVARSNLLGSVRKDINDYKSASPSQTDALLADRGRIDSSHRMIDDTLNQAYATREDFAQQRTFLARIDSRLGGVLSQIPGINSLISMIHSRRRRDSIIVACVVAFCVLLLLGYMFGF
ncbi:golgi snare protein [Tremella mesenterica]|uniref:Golgi SNAP receptor complex member 1 n=1 Tax=Tremella mesenterica TaxID=5217 RepID=A0A4Q1BCC0_TREME|nr:golgi snare protein [Tremella mesenterica]